MPNIVDAFKREVEKLKEFANYYLLCIALFLLTLVAFNLKLLNGKIALSLMLAILGVGLIIFGWKLSPSMGALYYIFNKGNEAQKKQMNE